jgi:hypothetical protein
MGKALPDTAVCGPPKKDTTAYGCNAFNHPAWTVQCKDRSSEQQNKTNDTDGLWIQEH